MQATIVFQKNWEAIHAMAYHEDGSPVIIDGKHQRKYKYIIDTGSSRSSKTASLIQCSHLYAQSNENKRITVWRDTKKDCKDTVLNDAIKYMRMWGIWKRGFSYNKTESVFTYDNGSTYEFHGTDDEEKVHGLNKSVAHINEPYKISWETFNQIDLRTEDFIIIDWNPKKGHWIDTLAKSDRAIVIHSTFKDNPFCPAEEKRKIQSYQPVIMSKVVIDGILTEQEAKTYDLIKNELNITTRSINELLRCRNNEATGTSNIFDWQVYGLGMKGERPNRIFRWKECSIEDYRAIDAPIYIGTDWGTVDPWAIIEAKYTDGRLYVHERNYHSENQLTGRMTSTEKLQFTADQSEIAQEGGIVTWMFSKLGISRNHDTICDTNRPLKIAALRRAGYRAHPTNKVKGSIVDGISVLQNIQVFYTRESENIAYEQENYSWELDTNGTVTQDPEDTNNHAIDAIRYVALYLQSRGIIKHV